MFQQLIHAQHKATKGITTTSGIKKPKSWPTKILGKTSLFEKIWYATFFLAGLLCLLILPLTPILIFTILGLWGYMIAGNMTARGLWAGFVVALACMVVYVSVCAAQKVWGEVIINIAVSIPMAVIALFRWKKGTKADQKEVTVNSMHFSDAIFWLGANLLVGILLGLFLQFIGQKHAYLNSFLIAIGISGDIIRNSAKKEFWHFYILSNAVGIIMWIQVSLDSDFSTFPYAISYFAMLANSINGMIYWNKLQKQIQKTKGIYLARRNIKITKIIKLRHKHATMTWKEDLDENWKVRQKI